MHTVRVSFKFVLLLFILSIRLHFEKNRTVAILELSISHTLILMKVCEKVIKKRMRRDIVIS